MSKENTQTQCTRRFKQACDRSSLPARVLLTTARQIDAAVSDVVEAAEAACNSGFNPTQLARALAPRPGTVS